MSARLLLQLHVHVRRDLDLRVGFLLVEARHDVQANQESWADFYVDKLLLIPMQMVCRCLREEISGGAKINLKS